MANFVDILLNISNRLYFFDRKHLNEAIQSDAVTHKPFFDLTTTTKSFLTTKKVTHNLTKSQIEYLKNRAMAKGLTTTLSSIVITSIIPSTIPSSMANMTSLINEEIQSSTPYIITPNTENYSTEMSTTENYSTELSTNVIDLMIQNISTLAPRSIYEEIYKNVSLGFRYKNNIFAMHF